MLDLKAPCTVVVNDNYTFTTKYWINREIRTLGTMIPWQDDVSQKVVGSN